jgi:hypothetical protein
MAFLYAILKKPVVTLPVATVIFFVVIFVGFEPVYVNSGPTRDSARSEVEKLTLEKKDLATVTKEVSSTWLVSKNVFASARWNKDAQRAEAFSVYERTDARWDRLFILVAAWLLALVLLAAAPRLALQDAVREVAAPKLDTEELLVQESQLARAQARALYSRSTVLLLGGILIAFTGVAVFVAFLPDESHSPRTLQVNLAERAIFGERSPIVRRIGPDGRVIQEVRPIERDDDARRPIVLLIEKSPEHFVSVVKEVLSPASFSDFLAENFVKALRPFGILIFIESIAWFLLRQYRAMMEDYKVFYRGYLRRTNYLTAFKILRGAPAPDGTTLAFVAALLGEDLSGRLKRDETTEGLEALKSSDPNPVFEMFSTALSKLKSPFS